MSFTFNHSAGATSNAAGATLDVIVAGVFTGDLICAWLKWETNNTLATFAEQAGGSKPADGYGASTGDFVAGSYFGRFAYILAGTGGSITYRMTTNALADFRNIVVFVFTPSAPAVLDGTSVGAIGTNPPLSSGNITTVGADGVAFGSYAEFSSSTLSAPLINGLTPEHTDVSGGATEMWSKLYSAGFTGAAAATLTPSAGVAWGSSIIAFQILAAKHRKLRMGVR